MDRGANEDSNVVYPHPASPELFATVAALWANACDAEPHCPAAPPPSFYPMILHLAVVDLTVAYDESTAPEDVPDEAIPQAAGMLRMRRLRYRGAVLLGKVLARYEEERPVDLVIASGATPLLAAFLGPAFDDEPALQHCAAWALSNAASGTSEQTLHVAQLPGFITNIIRHIQGRDSLIAEECLRGVCNIAGGSAHLRDVLLDNGAGTAVVHVLSRATQPSRAFLRDAIQAQSNLCRGKPPPRPEHVQAFVPIFASLIVLGDEQFISDDVIADALWGLSHLTEENEKMMDALMRTDGALSNVISAIQRGCTALQAAALQVAGNFCGGTAEQTRAVVELGLMQAMPAVLTHLRKEICKNAASALSNILACDPAYITLMLNQNVFAHVLQKAQATQFEVRKYAVLCIANAATDANPVDVQRMLDAGVVPIVCQALQEPQHQKIESMLLEVLKNLLEKAPAATSAAVEACGGVDLLQHLLRDANLIQSNARRLLERFFEARVAA